MVYINSSNLNGYDTSAVKAFGPGYFQYSAPVP